MSEFGPPHIFISYSHKDNKWLERLQVFLKPLEREGLVQRWDDTRIDPGGLWKEEIRKAIESSFAAVLLISADFLASDFIASNELPPLLAAAETRGLVILPVLVSPCGFARTKGLSKFQAINPDLKPLIDMRKGAREALWDKVVEAIQKALPSASDRTLDLLPSNITNPELLKQPSEYDDSLYEYDRAKIICSAGLREGALLYRIASLSHRNKGDLVSGLGSLFHMSQGRFHRPQQRTTYCSNNVLISIAESLFHMYRRMLDAITRTLPVTHIKTSTDQCLVAFRVHEIDDLVYAEATEASVLFPPMSRALLLQPDPIIGDLLDFGDRVRINAKRGILYPSPRHSRGLCVALFKDETNRIRRDLYEKLYVKLQLIREDHETTHAVKDLDLYRDVPDSTRGYYSFKDSTQFKELQKAGIIYPYGIPSSGVVDFVRRPYSNYPTDAVWEISKPSKSGVDCPLALKECPNYAKL